MYNGWKFYADSGCMALGITPLRKVGGCKEKTDQNRLTLLCDRIKLVDITCVWQNIRC